jgi:hypothetical protein
MYHRTLQAQKMSHRGSSHHQARNAPSVAEKRLHRHQPPEKNRPLERSGLEDAKVRYSPPSQEGPSREGAIVRPVGIIGFLCRPCHEAPCFVHKKSCRIQRVAMRMGRMAT